MNYLEALRVVHETLSPENYVEIGCRKGSSMSKSRCPSVGVDPDFEISAQIEAPVRLFKQTSDDFFAQHKLRDLLGAPVSLAFIDGMHLAEYVLRDFVNLEAQSTRDTVILIDDVLPENIVWTSRERLTQAWTGDVYKFIPLLRTVRPDLKIEVFDIEMKGLAVVSNLDPKNQELRASLIKHEIWLSGHESALESVKAIRATLNPRPAKDLIQYCQDLKAGKQTPSRATDQTTLYLDLLKRCVLNEIYLDDELRMLYLRKCLDGEEEFDYATYHDIRDTRRSAYRDMQASREIGRLPERNIHKLGFNHSMMGRKRMDSLHDCLNAIKANGIPGDFMECGVWRGGGCIFMAGYIQAHSLTGQRVLVADSFEGLPKPSHALDAKIHLDKENFPELAVSKETVEENFSKYGLLNDNIIFLKGWFRDTLPRAPTEQIALLRLDGDLYESTMDALSALYDKVSIGGVVIIDDFGAIKVCEQAVRNFFALRDEPFPKIEVIDWTGVYWIKTKPGLS